MSVILNHSGLWNLSFLLFMEDLHLSQHPRCLSRWVVECTGPLKSLLVWVSQVLLCSGCTLEIWRPRGGFWDQSYDFSCELASLFVIPAQSVLLGLDTFLFFVYSTGNFITVPLGMNWLQFLCMLGTKSQILFQALGNLYLTLQNGVYLFIYVFIYLFTMANFTFPVYKRSLCWIL